MPAIEAMKMMVKAGELQHQTIKLGGSEGGGTNVLKVKFMFENQEARRKAMVKFEEMESAMADNGFGSAALKIGDDELEVQLTHDDKECLQAVKRFLQGDLTHVGSRVP